MDGQVPADQTFAAFLKKKGTTFQNKLLGPVRARLWRTGKITLQQMLDFRGQPLSPDDLQQIVRKNRAAAQAAAAQVSVTPRPAEPVQVPDFKNSAEAERWFSENMLRKDNTGLGWINSYDRRGLKIVAEVTLEMRQRFNMQLPSYFGDPAKHPKFRFRSSRGALASVHMPSDSLLSKTTGLNKAPNQKQFERISKPSYKQWRQDKTMKAQYVPGQTFKRTEPVRVVDWFVSEAEDIGDQALIRAAKQAAEAGNEWTAGNATMVDWQDYVRKTFIHETGHRLHAQNLQEIDRILGGVGDQRKKFLWKRQTSEYAATNDKEWFAESFVHYIEGRHDRIYPPLLRWLKDHDRGS
jgi:hypothetical protein